MTGPADHTVHIGQSKRTPTLDPRSAVFGLAVELYQCHVPDDWGRCRCRTPRCPVRARAAAVIRAAGVNPAAFDPPHPTIAKTNETYHDNRRRRGTP